jgi:NhaP-type Na+/H+ or K+/H+ antiporter
MKSASNIFAVLLLLAGATFSLQGANILPGSWMTGKIEWLIIGMIMIGIAIGLLVWRSRQHKPDA